MRLIDDNHIYTYILIPQELPNLIEPLLNERDRFLAYRLRACCSILAATTSTPHNLTVVAVVGMGHMKGILASFHGPIDEADLLAISQLPPTQTSLIRPTAVLAAGVVVVVAVAVWRLARR